MTDLSSVPPVNPLEASLKGIRVIDFSQIAAGPLCTMLLGDIGAEVIKVEPPGGDTARRLGPPFIEGESTLFLSLNRNKRSVTIDLKTEAGLARATELIDGADVLVESFRPGVADRLGIGHDSVTARNPDIIYCSISAFGQRGPWADRPGVDGALQAISGLMSINGQEGEPPSKIQAPIVDMTTGYQATIAILAALWKRRSGGVPAFLDVSLFSSALMLQQIPFTSYLMSGELPLRSGSGAPYATPNEAYRTADGYILVAAYQETHWPRFCESIDRADLAADRRFESLVQRMAHRTALTEELDAIFRTRDTAEWTELLNRRGVICAPVSDYRQVAASPQIAASGLLTTVSHHKLGEITMLGGALGGNTLPVSFPPPALDQLGEGESWIE